MKTIKIFALITLMFSALVAGVVNDHNGHKNEAKICYAIAVAAIVAPALMAPRIAESLGFFNKPYLRVEDDPYTRSELALIQFLGTNAKAQSQLDAGSGRTKFETYARAFRFVIPAAFNGRRELLNAASAFIQGAIPEEWNLGQLPLGYNVAVSHIRTGFVADAVVTTGQAGIAYTSQPNTWPSALRNGQLIFSQAGAIKAFVDVVHTGTMAAGFGSIGENDGLELQSPFILEENKATKFELYGSSGQAFASPAGGNLLELIMFGAMARPRA